MKPGPVLLEGTVLFVVVSVAGAVAQTGGIAGSVVSENGAVLEGVCVGAFDAPEDPAGLPAVTTTTAAGNYVIDGLAPGSYKVAFGSCECPYRWAFEFYDDRNDFGSGTAVPVFANQTTTGIDAALAPAPPLDLALTGIEVEDVAVVGIATVPVGWEHRIHVSVTNEGTATPSHSLLFVEACPKTDGECDEWVESDVIPPPGGTRTVSFDWDALGFVGDVEITAEVLVDDDPGECDEDDNRVATEHAVLLSGTDVGIRPVR